MPGLAPIFVGAIVIFLLIAVVVYLVTRHARWAIGLLLVGMVVSLAALRSYLFFTDFHLLMFYGIIIIGGNNLFTFLLAWRYQDPGEDHGQLDNLTQRIQIVYEVPIFREMERITGCLQSIVEAAWEVSAWADVHIIAIDDASPDGTWDVLLQFAHDHPKLPCEILIGDKLSVLTPEVFESTVTLRLMQLQHNAGKKFALAAGACGSEQWLDGFSEFWERHHREPGPGDYDELLDCLWAKGAHPIWAHYVAQTDSDSKARKEYIWRQLLVMQSDPRIGASSGHCGIWLDDGDPSLMTLAQIPTYTANFRVRKAAESTQKSTFCVSGPGAFLRATALMPLLPKWVFHKVFGETYKGATDRKVTIELLKNMWLVVYSFLARVETIVPDTATKFRNQLTRWKMNFWAVLVDVWLYAHRAPPAVAFITYTRLLTTILGPLVLAYHIHLLMRGQFLASLLYLLGILAMGFVWGVAAVHYSPDELTFRQALRPIGARMYMSLFSSIRGTPMTLRALYKHLYRGRGFTWRADLNGRERRRILGIIPINPWFEPTFELRYYELIIFAEILVQIGEIVGII